MANYDFSGTWYNELHSTMELQVGAAGLVTGRYQTGVGVPPGQWFQLTGFVVEDVITFAVNWGQYQSVTAWVGQVSEEAGQPRLETLWHLAANVEDPEEPAKLWASIKAGADVFTRQRSAKAKKARGIVSHPIMQLRR